MNTLPSISEHIDEKIINKVIQDNFAALAPAYFTLTSNWFVRAYDHYKDIHDGEVIKVGELTLLAICTPGHYFDSICYKIDPVLFTGDTMYVGRTGRVKSAKTDIQELYDSVYNKNLT